MIFSFLFFSFSMVATADAVAAAAGNKEETTEVDTLAEAAHAKAAHAEDAHAEHCHLLDQTDHSSCWTSDDSR